MFKVLNKFIFAFVLFLSVGISVQNLLFAESVVALAGVRTEEDILQARDAGFNAVVLSENITNIPFLYRTAEKNEVKIIQKNSSLTEIKLFNDKNNISKKEELRFSSYNEIINGAKNLLYLQSYMNEKPLYKEKKDWRNIVDVIQEISFITEIIDKGNKINNPMEIKEPLKAESYEYGGIKYTFILNPTEKRHTLPTLFFQQSFDVAGEKSSNLKKVIRNAKNNFKPYKVFVFRYE